MAESSQTRQRDNSLFSAGMLAAALDAALFQQVGSGFCLVSPPPKWLSRLMPDAQEGENTDLVTRFPLLEVFLTDAERSWSGEDDSPLDSDLWAETIDGSEVHLQARAIRYGTFRLLLLSCAEETHRAHQQLQQYAHEIALLNREVERANRAKSDFLANMSHEIRTPMNAILGMAEVLSETELTADQRRYVETFQRAGSNLLAIINDILDLSKVESGRITLECIPFDLFDLVERAVELIRVKAAETRLKVRSAITPEVPRYLMGDPTRLRQIIVNLLGNALKFTHQGCLTVSVAAQTRTEKTVTLLFAIADTGVGIPADKLDTIFDSFAQADSSTARQYGGTGLGLTISKRLVELMGGHIWLESVIDRGSTFFFTAQFGHAQEFSDVAPIPAHTTTVPHCRVLLADDSEDNRSLVYAYLRNLPVTLDYADNGEVALRKLIAGNYDLVVMDVHMPILDGVAATVRYRQYEREQKRPPLPILALTADAFQEAIDRSLAAGFTAHLSKPIRKATLLEAIAKYARTGESAEEIIVQIDPLIADIVPAFLTKIRQNPEAIQKAIQARDLKIPLTLGHNMKGTGTAYGFPVITHLGAAIEQAAKDGNWDCIRDKTAELASYLEKVRVEYP